MLPAGHPTLPIPATVGLQARALEPAPALRPQAPQPIVPRSPATGAVQPNAGNAFALPARFNLKPPGSGRPLPESVQKKMEAFFNASFADIRVHVGQEAQSIGALAFTHGPDLYFAPGQYNPQSAFGQQLLGHELTHVLQQRAGRVRNPLGSGIAVVHDPVLEAEADRMGLRARSLQTPVQAKPASPSQSIRPVAPLTAAARRPVSVLLARPSRSIQRLVAIASDMTDIDDADVAVYHMIDLAFKKAGGPIVDFRGQPDFSRLGLTETFYIVEHGRPGLIEQADMTVLIEKLTRDGTGLPPGYRGTIVVTACWGAVRDTKNNVDAVIDQLAAALKVKWPGVNIVGAKGQTIVSSNFAAGIEVLNPAKDYKGRYFEAVSQAGFGDKKKEWLTWLKSNRGQPLEVKAAKCVEIFTDVQARSRETMASEGFLFTDTEGRTRTVVS
jgi:hypothetical protein